MKFRTTAAALALMTSSTAMAQAIEWKVEDGGNGHWYAIGIQPGVIWSQARSNSQVVGADLATLKSATELEFVFNALVNDPTVWSGRLGPWIGLLQDPDGREPADGWRWIDGEALAFSNWWTFGPDSMPWEFGPCLDSDFANFYGYPDTPVATWGAQQDFQSSACHWESYRSYLMEWSADCDQNGLVDYGEIVRGEKDDANANNIPDCCEGGSVCPCAGDADENAIVDAIELAIVLARWGSAPKDYPRADANGDGVVDAQDLSAVLSAWGPCGG